MSESLDAFARSWPSPGFLAASLCVTVLVYLRGWLSLRRRDSIRWTAGQLVAFLAGCIFLYLALASPIEAFASFSLCVHMVQHVLLLMVVPPLLLAGAPLIPMVRGAPRMIRALSIAPLFHSKGLRLIFTRLTHPAAAFCVAAVVYLGWHIPAAYELALGSDSWHYAQHLSFLFAAMLFWYPVLQPYPSRPRWSAWLLLPYLLLADVQNTVLSAVFTFSGRVIYPSYQVVPNPWGISALQDQAAAGVVMWIPGSIAFLVPLTVIGVRLLHGGSPARGRAISIATPSRQRLRALPSRPSRAIDVTRLRGADLITVPWLGVFLRWRHARAAVQFAMLLLAALVVFDGWMGPQIGAMNLAGVLPWTYWRGFAVIGLLVVGNVACMACPFTLPRAVAGRWMRGSHAWPRILRNKWLPIALVLLFLWSYEVLALWDDPWLTAWIIVGYFVAAFAVDSVFRGSTFCKYVCPIGQFHFVQSLVSPGEIRALDPSVCSTCKSVDCVKGNENSRGCQLELVLPKKSGNMDCTFCLDCVHACPNDNVGLVLPYSPIAPSPLRPLPRLQPKRSSTSTHATSRLDIVALIAVFTLGAFANAAAMVAPVVDVQDRWSESLGFLTPAAGVTLYCLITLIIAPGAILTAAVLATRRIGEFPESAARVLGHYVVALVPLGFAMWLAHLTFHLVTGFGSAVPVVQRFAADLGWNGFAAPSWSLACCANVPTWLLPLEITLLNFGLLGSLAASHRIGKTYGLSSRRALGAAFPWAIVIVMLFVLGLWIVFQPMQMRGTLSA